MATYKQIQNYIKNEYGYTAKTCWIAHVKEMSGLDVNLAPKRNDIKKRKYPCPEDKVEPIKDAFRHFGMI
jgi:hypothetical protein